MAAQEKVLWKNWADGLRQEMMSGLTAEVTKTVDAIAEETATTKAESTWRSARFWQACKSGKSPNDFIAKAGFEVEFEQNEARHVQEVTLRLNQTWMTILQGAIDRKEA